MKAIVPISILFFGVFLTSCTKEVIVAPQSPLIGSWVLTGAEREDSKGWFTYNTGLENGVFYFYENGSAEYVNGNLDLRGSWYTSTVSGGYYDQYGNYLTDLHTSMQVNVSDYYSNSSVNLNFDNITFSNSRFVATNYDGYGVDRYFFARY
ncbi:MAG: hypothetical protein C5B52_16680 [Bacteroidetes bacterium]|nr:MAG: hypothetical protein C5B52_16680 [Bacteroidota bacterium]